MDKVVTKADLRLKIKLLLREKTNDFFKDESLRICKDILVSQVYKNADVVLAYMPLFDEVDIVPVIKDALKSGKKVAVPRVIENTTEMIFYYLDSVDLDAQMVNGYCGIREPKVSDVFFSLKKDMYKDEKRDLKKVLILVPGRAFSNNGDRLGRGKGFYDKFLSSFSDSEVHDLCTAGVCFSCQIVSEISVSENDIPVDMVFC